jgi:hypothetical protein
MATKMLRKEPDPKFLGLLNPDPYGSSGLWIRGSVSRRNIYGTTTLLTRTHPINNFRNHLNCCKLLTAQAPTAVTCIDIKLLTKNPQIIWEKISIESGQNIPAPPKFYYFGTKFIAKPLSAYIF